MGAGQRLLVVGPVTGLGALVQDHDDVRAQLLLGADHHLRGKEVPRPIDVRAELYTLVADLAILGQAEHLKPTRVGEDRTVPAHEAVKATHLCHQLSSRAQVEVIGIPQDQLGPQFAQIAGIQGLDRGLGANRGKGRRRYLAVGGDDSSQASVTVRIGPQQCEIDSHDLQPWRIILKKAARSKRAPLPDWLPQAPASALCFLAAAMVQCSHHLFATRSGPGHCTPARDG